MTPMKTGNIASGLISHLGIAVANLDAAIERFQLISGKPDKIVEVADQKVRVAMFGGVPEGSATRIELVAPTSDDSSVAVFLEKRGEGLHHVCVYVDDLEKTLTELQAAGVKLIDDAPRVGADGNLIAFVHPSDMHGVLIELEERGP
jgi:methylmalonyl-CoA/ethylmalonyl-CoA epimerase